jgi:PAS domain-containing protein
MDYGGEHRLISIARDITDRKQAQERLQKAFDEVEAQVKERTKDLVRTNERLEKEIAVRKRAEERLREIRELDEKILDGSPVAFVLHDRDLRSQAESSI